MMRALPLRPTRIPSIRPSGIVCRTSTTFPRPAFHGRRGARGATGAWPAPRVPYLTSAARVAARCTAFRATPATSDQTATPTVRLMTAVTILALSAAPLVNGAGTPAAMARPMIQPKNWYGVGVVRSNTWIRPVATSAANPAHSAYNGVLTPPHAPSRAGASTGTPNSPRAIRKPTIEAGAATPAVARPPAHSRPASTAVAAPAARVVCEGSVIELCDRTEGRRRVTPTGRSVDPSG